MLQLTQFTPRPKSKYLQVSLWKALLSLLLALLVHLSAFATHNRAGEITFRHLSGLNYEILVVTYTRDSAPADRPALPINFGDGSPQAIMQRESRVVLPNDVARNIYRITHTFNGPGTYTITMEDPNRNENVLNIPGSVNVVFFLESTLTISAATGQNNSVILSVPPIDDGCLNQPYVHNPGAIDLDGDSLSFSLTESLADGGMIAPGFVFPDQVFPAANNNISIDPVTGTMVWDSPNQTGLYNVGILVKEWRNGLVVGEVLRDMQILIRGCANTPPQIAPVPDFCVQAGNNLNFNVTATDAGNTIVTLSATGLPFIVPNPATFSQVSSIGSAVGNFNWNTVCNHVRLAPYNVVYRATDNATTPIPLVNFETNNIRVIAPAPQNPTALPVGNSLALNWNESTCIQANGYSIYRRINEFGFTPDQCETGVPEFTGYTLIGTTSGLNSTSFTDPNVLFGRNYCYMVVANFPDGSESYASVEFCGQLVREVPAMTKISIGITDPVFGVDTVAWVHPIDLDTLSLFPPPYRYRLYRGFGFQTANELVFESEPSNFLLSLPTTFISEEVNTQDTALVYRVELLASPTNQVVSSGPSSSVWASLIPNDMQLEVVANFNVTWDNFEYDYFRLNDNTELFDFIGTTNQPIFLDTGLVNGQTYCYYIVAKGAYTIASLPDTLINVSQIVCGEPKDLTPPCPPTLTVPEDCTLEFNELEWTNPAETCGDLDTGSYNVFFRNDPNGEFVLIETLIGSFNTFLSHNDNGSLAGCYFVTAIDTVGNESEPSNIICVDNCPVIELPNVFTPNGDGVNDNFIPIKIRQILSVEITIYNRWGSIVHQREANSVLWDGTFLDTGEPVSEGTYFYVAKAKARTLRGIIEIPLTGNITVFIDKKAKFD
ncbi:MAG: T9SS type B sorting domain-containing protein [Luteibaculaceae bacterium]